MSGLERTRAHFEKRYQPMRKLLLLAVGIVGCAQSSLGPSLPGDKAGPAAAPEKKLPAGPLAELAFVISNPHTDLSGFDGAAISPDGNTLATIINTESVKLWDTADGKEKLTVKESKNAAPVMF